jgi:hypothetical protein
VKLFGKIEAWKWLAFMFSLEHLFAAWDASVLLHK